VGSLRTRLTVLIAIVVLSLGGAAGYLVKSRNDQKAAISNASTVPQIPLGAVENEPRIVFRNSALGPNYGFVAMVALNDPQGPRAFTKTSCDRVYSTTDRLVCLASSRGVVTTYSAHVYGPNLTSVQSLPLAGIPSRARLSNDGTLASTTSFTSGDPYAGTSFSTRTVVSRIGGATYGDLEQFKLIHNGVSINPSDRNYWGVTFAGDDNTFYATVEFSGHTWLVHGDLATRTMTTIHEDAECPSLSPDGKTIVFKQRGNLPSGKWRLVRYDIATNKVTPLAETRSVDDQVAWLNDSTVLYGIPRTGSQAAEDDVWEVPADGTGTPKLLIAGAWSPAVVN
jgi:hypothetical protein